VQREINQVLREFIPCAIQVNKVGPASSDVSVALDIVVAHANNGLHLVLEGTAAHPSVCLVHVQHRVELGSDGPLGAIVELPVSGVVWEGAEGAVIEACTNAVLAIHILISVRDGRIDIGSILSSI
jgi:hypothetical protein